MSARFPITMDFFHSLTLDLKFMVVGILGAGLLALFTSNQKAEKRYILVMAVLAAVGVYRFNNQPNEDLPLRRVSTVTVQPAASGPQQKQPALQSTHAK